MRERNRNERKEIQDLAIENHASCEHKDNKKGRK
jgi:hypothetical protein